MATVRDKNEQKLRWIIEKWMTLKETIRVQNRYIKASLMTDGNDDDE